MPIYHFRDYSNNHEKTTGSLWNCYRDQPKDDAVGNGNAKMAISLKDSKSFNYETKITGELKQVRIEIMISKLLYLQNI